MFQVLLEIIKLFHTHTGRRKSSGPPKQLSASSPSERFFCDNPHISRHSRFFTYHSFLHRPPEPSLRQFKYNDNSQNDCNCNLHRLISGIDGQSELLRNQIIHGPIDSGARNKGKDARYKKNSGRTLLSHCRSPGKENYNHCSCKSGRCGTPHGRHL